MLSNPTAHLLWALLAVNIIKGLAVFLAAYLITRLGKRISPDYKHLIWFIAITSFVVLPIIWFFLPELNSDIKLSTGVSQAWRLTAAPFLSRDNYMDHILKAFQFFVFPRETFSGKDEVVNAHTFKRAPKNISRYPSVKNLKKLLKK